MSPTIRHFLIFFTLLLVVYYPTRQAGFFSDFLGWQQSYNTQSFWQVLQADDRKIKSFYHLTHAAMWLMTWLFGFNGLAWYVVHSFLVALNATLILRLFIRLSQYFKFDKAELVGFLGLLAFLLSPYIAEVMVWRAAFHFPFAFTLQLWILHLVLNYYEKPQLKTAILGCFLFCISIFSLEYFFITPALAFAILLLLGLNDKTNFLTQKRQFAQNFLFFVGIPIVGIVVYTAAYFAKNGKLIAHGREDASSLFTNLNSYSTYGKYITKHLFFIRHLEHADKVAFFQFFNQKWVEWSIAALILTITVVGLYRFSRLSGFWKMLFASFCFFSLLMLPSVSQFFESILLSENDRYGFFPAPFLMLVLALLLSRLPRSLFLSVMIGYLILSFTLTYRTNSYWAQAGRVYWGLIDDFKWRDAKEDIVLLNVPDCLNGMCMYRSYDYISAFACVMDIYKGTKLFNKTHEAMRYNMTHESDGVYVVMDSPDTARVVFNQFGSWWMMKSYSTSDYEMPTFKVKQGDGDYKFILKPSPRPRIFLFQSGDKWHVLDTTKIGIVQGEKRL